VADAPAGVRSRASLAAVLPDKTLVRWLIVVGIAVAALILGYVGLHEYLSAHKTPEYGRGWADILYYDLQLFLLSAAPAQDPGPFPVALGIARFLAPAVSAAATVETVRLLLSEQLRRWSSASASRHAIVTGDGPVPVELAHRLRTQYRKVVLVTSVAPGPDQVRDRRLRGVSGDLTDASTLRAAGVRRADVLYACAELSATNAATALRAREILQADGRSLTTYAQVRDAEICIALRARRIGAKDDLRFRLDFFSLEDAASRVLLDKYPLAVGDARSAQVVIAGFGRLGRAVLRESARRAVPGGTPLDVRICGDGAETLQKFLDVFPLVARNCSVVWDDEALVRTAGDKPVLIFVCLPDNDDALSAGLAAAHSLTARHDRVVICMAEPSPLGAVLSGQGALLDDVEGRLAVFDVIEEACVPDKIREDLADQLARAIHRAYVENQAAQGASRVSNQSMRPWEELPDYLKESNLEQAAHIGIKLSMIDCVVVPESASAPDFAFTGAEIELLAQAEHARWVQERQARGYVYGPERTGNQHPDLADWEHLSAGAREKDRDAIRELPAILHEAGFQILRLPARSGP
jgi:hypothetical protein